MEFAPFVMAHKPLKMTIEEAWKETRSAWTKSYSPETKCTRAGLYSGMRRSSIGSRT